MNDALKQLAIWFKTSKLSLNIDKNNYIIFTLSKTTGIEDYKLNIDEKLNNRVGVAKYLFIRIDYSGSNIYNMLRKKSPAGYICSHFIQEHSTTIAHTNTIL